ncbi:MAG: XRE family transcriptional regulator [Lachnospiraceae bacterium]|nr:XRE family transcriptional regulator [Lachnospiraceae bacterium]
MKPTNKKTTNELLKVLSSVNTEEQLKKYTEYLEEQSMPKTFHEYINELILKHNRSLSIASIIENSQIQRNYGYQIINGTRRPGRDKILALSLTLQLSLKETQKGLTLAGENILYPKTRRDSILIFALQKQLSVLDTNELLFQFDEKTLE